MAANLARLRESINAALAQGEFDVAVESIAAAVPVLLEWGEDTWSISSTTAPAVAGGDTPAEHRSREAPAASVDAAADTHGGPARGADDRSSSDSSSESSGSDSSDDSDDGTQVHPITSYRYRSTLRLPRNPRLDHLCQWLYDTIVHPDTDDEPEEMSCQRLPAAIMAAWRRLDQQQQQQQQTQQLQQQPAGVDGSTTTAATAAAASPPLPPTEALHLQHSGFSAPYCTWRHVAADALPPLHDVLVGVLRVCWERHDDREPSRNVIWGAQQRARHPNPVTAYLYVEYLRLLVESIVRSNAEPLWLWHELQEVIEEYQHWRHHPHEVAVLARLMVEHGCGWRLLNSLLDHVGKGPLLMYGAWAALWDGLRRPEARACGRLAVQHGVAADAVWVHVVELTLLQVKEHPTDAKLLARAEDVLRRALSLTPAREELEALLRAERDAPASCAGVQHVTRQLDLGDGGAGKGQEDGRG